MSLTGLAVANIDVGRPNGRIPPEENCVTGSDIFIFCIFVVLGLTRPFYLFWLRATRPGGRKVRPWLQWIQLGAFYTTICLSALEHWHFFPRPLIWSVIIGALAVIAATQALKIWAIAELAPYWSAHVEIHDPHPLKKTGPYAWMRNPGYLNGIVESLCIPFISSSWFTLPFAVISVGVVFYLRITTEEQAMSNAKEASDGKSLGDEYKKYCNNVGRFVSPHAILKRFRSIWAWNIGFLSRCFSFIRESWYQILFWIIPAPFAIAAVCWLFGDLKKIYQYQFLVGPVDGHVGKHLIQLHQLLYEGICTIGVSAAILTAGMAIAAPLYQGVWQGMSDSLFELHQKLREMLRDNSRALDDKEKTLLRKHCSNIEETLDELQRRVRSANRRFRATLLFTVALLLFIIGLIAIPREGVVYVGAAVVTCLSVAVGLMFIHLIFEITMVKPASIRLTIQSDIAKIKG